MCADVDRCMRCSLLHVSASVVSVTTTTAFACGSSQPVCVLTLVLVEHSWKMKWFDHVWQRSTAQRLTPQDAWASCARFGALIRPGL